MISANPRPTSILSHCPSSFTPHTGNSESPLVRNKSCIFLAQLPHTTSQEAVRTQVDAELSFGRSSMTASNSTTNLGMLASMAQGKPNAGLGLGLPTISSMTSGPPNRTVTTPTPKMTLLARRRSARCASNSLVEGLKPLSPMNSTCSSAINSATSSDGVDLSVSLSSCKTTPPEFDLTLKMTRDQMTGKEEREMVAIQMKRRRDKQNKKLEEQCQLAPSQKVRRLPTPFPNKKFAVLQSLTASDVLDEADNADQESGRDTPEMVKCASFAPGIPSPYLTSVSNLNGRVPTPYVKKTRDCYFEANENTPIGYAKPREVLKDRLPTPFPEKTSFIESDSITDADAYDSSATDSS